jgi:hypothetical protein
MDLFTFEPIPPLENKEDSLKIRKECNKFWSESAKEAKENNCLFCNTPAKGFCNSHSVPAFVLKNISENGLLYNNNKLIKFSMRDDTKGVGSTGTFRLICRTCDSIIFSDYENPENYNSTPTQKMLSQIAMKNYLKQIYKKNVEFKLYAKIESTYGFSPQIPQNINDINILDYKEYIKEFNRAKKISIKPNTNEYYLFLHEKLDYVTPMAFQDSVALIVDLEGSIINNVHDMDPKYVIQQLHICVFPMENHTEIMLFIDSKHNRYRNFYKQLRKINSKDKLAIITYIIFSCSEDIFISPMIDKNVLDNKAILDASKKTSGVFMESPMDDPMDVLKEEFSFSKISQFPNILSDQYKIR